MAQSKRNRRYFALITLGSCLVLLTCAILGVYDTTLYSRTMRYANWNFIHTATHDPGGQTTMEGLGRSTLAEGRNPKDGHVASVQLGFYTIYMYSAFWDDRWELESDPVIRVLVMIKAEVPRWSELDKKLRCVFSCRGKETWSKVKLDSHVALLGTHRLNEYRYDKQLLTFQAGECKDPDRMTLTFAKNADAIPERGEVIPVERMTRNSVQMDLATCRPTMWGTIDPHEMVEWLELQKLLGIGKVVVYNDSLDAVSSRVLRHYEEEGYVDLWQMNCTEHAREMVRIWKPLSVTDCVYRYMYDFKRMLCIDSDEVIVPKLTETLPELIRELDKNETSYNGTNLRVNYSFLGALYPCNTTNDIADSSQPERSVYLRYRRRFPHTNYQKSVFNPRGCLTARNHNCSSSLPFYAEHRPGHTELADTVEPDVGDVHHYRQEINKKYWRAVRDKTQVQDDSMMRYADRLIPNVRKRLQLLGLSLEY